MRASLLLHSSPKSLPELQNKASHCEGLGQDFTFCTQWWNTDKKTTFVDVCSEKGSQFFRAAIKAGYIKIEQLSTESTDTRKKKHQRAIELARQWQEKDFASLEQMSSDERLSYWFGQFSKCIKCYGCRDACPICYCKDCFLEADRGFISPGEVPPDIILPNDKDYSCHGVLRQLWTMSGCLYYGAASFQPHISTQQEGRRYF
jgi:ferredoxin